MSVRLARTFRPPHEEQPGEPTPASITLRQVADSYVEEHVKKFCKPSAMRNVPWQRRRLEQVLVPSDGDSLIPLSDKPIVAIYVTIPPAGNSDPTPLCLGPRPARR
jgi:hypothetical protein